MKTKLLMLISFLLLATNIVAAEKLATVLRGKIIANNLSGIVVLIKERDGSILDMTDISKQGIYQLDLTIMDTPTQKEVNKLIVEVKNKDGRKKTFSLHRYLNVFSDTVLLHPIVLQ